MSIVVVGTVKSNSSNPPTIQNTSGTEIGTFCRAWVNFNGTTVTNPASMTGVRGSFNVSSVLDNGTGDYTVNFTTAMPDANYAVGGINSGASSNADWAIFDAGSGGTNPTSSAVRVRATANGNVVDTVYCNVAIFR